MQPLSESENKMGRKPIEAYEVECDTCERGALVTGQNQLPVGWYTGTVLHRDAPDTEATGEFTVCSIRCIRKAVDKALSEPLLPEGSTAQEELVSAKA